MRNYRQPDSIKSRFELIAVSTAAVLCAAAVLVSVILFEKSNSLLSNSLIKIITPRENGSFHLLELFTIDQKLSVEKNDPFVTYIGYGKDLDEVLMEHENAKAQTLPEGSYPIVEDDISNQDSTKKILLRNKSAKKITDETIAGLLSAEYPITAKRSSEPLVLILHTHTTESYAPSGVTSYVPANAVAETRSHKDSENMIAVGNVIADVLVGMGIPTLHCTDYHDVYVFNESYDHSYDTVKAYLDMYPSIKYVIDVHRDSVIRTNGDKVCPVYEVDGKKAAQVMLVVGTDSGMPHKNWQKNFTLAVKLQQRLVDSYQNLARPINLREGRFNQQLSAGMLLLEVGSCGNTLEQAKYSARLVASELGELINENLS